MATKGKIAKRVKTLTKAKKLGTVKPLLKFELTDPQLSHVSTGSGGGDVPTK